MAYMYPFNVIEWVKQVLLAGTLSTLLGAIYLGLRWRYWDRSWVASAASSTDNLFEQVWSQKLKSFVCLLILGERRNTEVLGRHQNRSGVYILPRNL